MPDTLDPAVRELLDKQAIHEVVLRYCRGIDRMDRELVRSCYHADAEDHHGRFHGDVDAFLDWVFELIVKYDSSMHFVGNILIEPRGDLARAETYGMAFHRGDPEKPHRSLITGFRYIDRFERRAGDWRIAKRTATTEWVRKDVPEHWWPIGEGFLRGSRDRSDPVYEPLDQADSATRTGW